MMLVCMVGLLTAFPHHYWKGFLLGYAVFVGVYFGTRPIENTTHPSGEGPFTFFGKFFLTAVFVFVAGALVAALCAGQLGMPIAVSALQVMATYIAICLITLSIRHFETAQYVVRQNKPDPQPPDPQPED